MHNRTAVTCMYELVWVKLSRPLSFPCLDACGRLLSFLSLFVLGCGQGSRKGVLCVFVRSRTVRGLSCAVRAAAAPPLAEFHLPSLLLHVL